MTVAVAVVRRAGSLTIGDADLRAVMSVVEHRPHPRSMIRVRAVGSNLPGLYDGIVNELARRNVDVCVDPEAGRLFGASRTLASNAAAETWYVTEQGSLLPGLLSRSGAHLLVTTSPLTPPEDAELTKLQESVGRALDRAGLPERRAFLDSSLAGFHLNGVSGIDPAQVVRLGQLNAKVERRTAAAVRSSWFPPEPGPSRSAAAAKSPGASRRARAFQPRSGGAAALVTPSCDGGSTTSSRLPLALTRPQGSSHVVIVKGNREDGTQLGCGERFALGGA